MSEVEVYSVNKLKFWAMDKNVVGKKKFASGPGAPQVPPSPLPPTPTHPPNLDALSYMCTFKFINLSLRSRKVSQKEI